MQAGSRSRNSLPEQRKRRQIDEAWCFECQTRKATDAPAAAALARSGLPAHEYSGLRTFTSLRDRLSRAGGQLEDFVRVERDDVLDNVPHRNDCDWMSGVVHDGNMAKTTD